MGMIKGTHKNIIVRNDTWRELTRIKYVGVLRLLTRSYGFVG